MYAQNLEQYLKFPKLFTQKAGHKVDKTSWIKKGDFCLPCTEVRVVACYQQMQLA